MTTKNKSNELPAWSKRGVTAGPDDPIYKGGLRVSLGRPEPSTDSTTMETPAKRLPDPLPELNTNFAQLAEEVRKQVMQESGELSGAVSDEDNEKE